MNEEDNVHGVPSNCQMPEYANQLRSWLNQAYQYQCLPYLVAACPPPINLCHPTANLSNIPPPHSPPSPPQTAPRDQPRPTNEERIANGRVCRVPKLTKRLLAEVIDFILLFLIKAFITLSILESWNIDDLEDYQSEEDEENAEYQFALAVTANIMTIEVIHRLIVVCYEVWFTMQGGATPGKRTMGIRIITCTRSEPIAEDSVMVVPATEISFWKALSRAFLKNMGTALLFPTYVPLMFVQQNRTLYDIMCNTIVIEV